MRKIAVGTLMCLVAALAVTPGAEAASSRPHLAELVKLKDIRRHQAALQKISDYNGRNRAAGQPGFAVSVKYVVRQLKDAGFKPQTQQFPFSYYEERSPSVFEQTAPTAKKYTFGTDYATLQYSGKGDVTAAAAAVDPAAAGVGSGCETGDFANFPKGAIALIQRGGCFFRDKAANAKTAGATAVVIYQRPDVPDAPVAGSLEQASTIPVIGPTNKLGVELVKAAQAGGLKLRVTTDTVNEVRQAANVIAETKRGRADNVVVVGAHLDSVGEGPGINDNGSGSAALLATAQKIGKLGNRVRNKVRFAWWGAEEEGLLGSQYYVDHLSKADKDKIALNLNFDMLGSPNGIRGVYDGDDSQGTGSKPPPGSGAIEKVFNDYYGKRRLATSPSPFNGRSDYGPFIAAGIPAGGLDSGAEGIKTAAEAKTYGGQAGKPYDGCYHQACDGYKNVNTTILDHLADGAAFATETFAYSTLPVNGGQRRTTGHAAARPDRLGHYWIR